MTMMRSERTKRAIAARTQVEREADHQTVFRERARLRRHDGDFRVSLGTYERWLPKAMVDAYRHFEGGVPLIVIENEIAALVPDLNDPQLADLMFQLDGDVCKAEAASGFSLPERYETPSLTEEEDLTVEEFFSEPRRS